MKLPKDIEAEIQRGWHSSALEYARHIGFAVAMDCANELQNIADTVAIGNANKALYYAKASQALRQRYGL